MRYHFCGLSASPECARQQIDAVWAHCPFPAGLRRKEGKNMSNLNQVELQNLRHLIGSQDTCYEKLNNYASQCVDPQIKQMFTGAAQDSLNTKQKLLTFLN